MRVIERSNAFDYDYKGINAKPRHDKQLELLVGVVIQRLSLDHPLPLIYRDHALMESWVGYRACHVKFDVWLIYKKPDSYTVRLARLGSHDSLFKT